MRRLGGFSALTCLQQAAMNFGIPLIQRLVDSFRPGGHGGLCCRGED